jgi:hypothetical protein
MSRFERVMRVQIFIDPCRFGCYMNTYGLYLRIEDLGVGGFVRDYSAGHQRFR